MLLNLWIIRTRKCLLHHRRLTLLAKMFANPLLQSLEVLYPIRNKEVEFEIIRSIADSILNIVQIATTLAFSCRIVAWSSIIWLTFFPILSFNNVSSRKVAFLEYTNYLQMDPLTSIASWSYPIRTVSFPFFWTNLCQTRRYSTSLDWIHYRRIGKGDFLQ